MTEMSKTKVVVAMSGGVDSSVAAALLVENGYDVSGMMLRLWSEDATCDSNRCCSPESISSARLVAGQLDIPFYVLDAKDIFKRKIVDPFVADYLRGDTPNPCLKCNKFIRWGFLLEQAKLAGADYLATGHYARLTRSQNGQVQLRKAYDTKKDQSYVLYSLDQSQLSRTMLPVGEYTKADVRRIAARFDLSVSTRKDSQDLCFIGDSDYISFIWNQTQQSPSTGEIINLEGEILGQHDGVLNFTIGQRKGIGVSSHSPYYVVDKISEKNQIVVAHKDSAGREEFFVGDLNWINGITPDQEFNAKVKIRYQSKEISGSVLPSGGDRVRIKLQEKLSDISPGQAAVIYDDDIVLGGGTILNVR